VTAYRCFIVSLIFCLQPLYGLRQWLLFRVDFYMSHHEVGCATTDENVYAVDGRWR
jgi:hypothetical protein